MVNILQIKRHRGSIYFCFYPGANFVDYVLNGGKYGAKNFPISDDEICIDLGISYEIPEWQIVCYNGQIGFIFSTHLVPAID